MSDSFIIGNASSENESCRRRGCAKSSGPLKCRGSAARSQLARLTEASDIYRTVLGPTTDETILAGLQTVMEMCLQPTQTYMSQSDRSSATNCSGVSEDQGALASGQSRSEPSMSKCKKSASCMTEKQNNLQCMSVQHSAMQDTKLTMTDVCKCLQVKLNGELSKPTQVSKGNLQIKDTSKFSESQANSLKKANSLKGVASGNKSVEGHPLGASSRSQSDTTLSRLMKSYIEQVLPMASPNQSVKSEAYKSSLTRGYSSQNETIECSSCHPTRLSNETKADESVQYPQGTYQPTEIFRNQNSRPFPSEITGMNESTLSRQSTLQLKDMSKNQYSASVPSRTTGVNDSIQTRQSSFQPNKISRLQHSTPISTKTISEHCCYYDDDCSFDVDEVATKQIGPSTDMCDRDNHEEKAKLLLQKAPEEVKYAITRISKFPSYIVYEILKPTKAKPKSIPTETDGVFVLKRN